MTLIESDTQLAGVDIEGEPRCQYSHKIYARDTMAVIAITPCSEVAVATMLTTCRNTSMLICSDAVSLICFGVNTCLFCKLVLFECRKVTPL